MNELSFKKLEFNKIIDILMKQCASSLGKQIVSELKPINDYEKIIKNQNETAEAVKIKRFETNVPLAGITDTYIYREKAKKSGILSEEELGSIRENLYAARKMKNLFSKKRQYDVPLLEEKQEDIVYLKELDDEIDSVLDEENKIRNTASEKLNSLRRKKDQINLSIRSKLNSIVRNQNMQKYLQDSIVTIRQDRYVIPIKQEYRQHLPGIIHDQSASGATLFVEPMSVVDLNNDLKKVELEEREEILRILKELSEKVALDSDQLKLNLDILGEFDFIFAKANLSNKYNCVKPKILKDQKLNIIKGRHPLIPPEEVVPTSINLGIGFDALVVTGPNTGGKTVSIKTTGLFVMMAQSGLHLPVELGTEIGVFDKVFCDIGDEQSIEQSLSTFSSHMKNIVNIINEVNSKTLVLLDELGAGTDPAEGANLAISIIKYFLDKRAKVIATTHYSDLKVFAYNNDRVENSSVEFDNVSLRPTYKLLIGVPGKSNALEIAKRLGIDYEIIESAKAMTTDEDTNVSNLIEKLEKESYYTEENLKQTKVKLDEAEKKLNILKERENLLKEKERLVLKKAEEEAHRIVRNARLQSENIVKEIKELHKLETDKARAIDKANVLKKDLEKSEEKHYSGFFEKKKKSGHAPTSEEIELGEEVFVDKFNQRGIVLEKDGKNLLLQIGVMKVKAKSSEVTKLKAKAKKADKSSYSSIVQEKSFNIKPELDFRGARYEEAIELVDKYLDDAKLAGLNSVTLIHGKGTGALRQGVQELLRHHSSVKSYRNGNYKEGGAGVTVVEIK